MKTWLQRWVLMLMVPAISLVLTACGGGSDDDDEAPAPAASSTNTTDGAGTSAPAPAPSMTGNWVGEFGTGVAFSMALTQTGDAISGDYKTGAVDGSVSGTLSGNSITMTVTIPAGATSEWSGNVNEARTQMSGSFNIVAGGGGSGTWSATK